MVIKCICVLSRAAVKLKCREKNEVAILAKKLSLTCTFCE